MQESIQFIVNEAGDKISAVIPIHYYETMMDALEVRDDVQAFDDAINSDKDIIPFNKALEEIGRTGTH